jgi:hypothetical protein
MKKIKTAITKNQATLNDYVKNHEHHFLNKKELDKKLKKVSNQSEKNLKEKKKLKKDYETQLKKLDEEEAKLARKRNSIQNKYRNLEYKDDCVSKTLKLFFIPPEIFRLIIQYCSKRNPFTFLINKETYNYLQESSFAFYQEDNNLSLPLGTALNLQFQRLVDKTDIDTPSNWNETNLYEEEFVYKRFLNIVRLVFSFIKRYSYDENSILQNFIEKYRVNDDIVLKHAIRTPDEVKEIQSNLRRQVYILDILTREILHILDHTIAFHKAAYSTSLPIVKMNDEKTMKWYLEQKVTVDKNNKLRHYLGEMHIILEENGGSFFISEDSFKWFDSLIWTHLRCHKECRIEYGKPRAVQTYFEFCKKNK